MLELCYFNVLFFFFFQAEDGIRDWSVTGVQTCALPIYITDGKYNGIGALIRKMGDYVTITEPYADCPAAKIGRASCRERV